MDITSNAMEYRKTTKYFLISVVLFFLTLPELATAGYVKVTLPNESFTNGSIVDGPLIGSFIVITDNGTGGVNLDSKGDLPAFNINIDFKFHGFDFSWNDGNTIISERTITQLYSGDTDMLSILNVKNNASLNFFFSKSLNNIFTSYGPLSIGTNIKWEMVALDPITKLFEGFETGVPFSVYNSAGLNFDLETGNGIFNATAVQLPEPSIISLMMAGLIGFGASVIPGRIRRKVQHVGSQSGACPRLSR